MIPWLTECLRPNGLPSAMTHVPIAASSLLPSRAAGRSSRSSLRTAMSALLSVHTLPAEIERAVAQKHADLAGLRAIDHVMIGQHEKARSAVAADDDARAGFLELTDSAVFLGSRGLLSDDVHHRRRDRLGYQLERAVYLLELFVLFGEDLVDRVVGDLSGEPSGFASDPVAEDANGSPRPVPATWAKTTGRPVPGSFPARFPHSAMSMRR